MLVNKVIGPLPDFDFHSRQSMLPIPMYEYSRHSPRTGKYAAKVADKAALSAAEDIQGDISGYWTTNEVSWRHMSRPV